MEDVIELLTNAITVGVCRCWTDSIAGDQRLGWLALAPDPTLNEMGMAYVLLWQCGECRTVWAMGQTHETEQVRVLRRQDYFFRAEEEHLRQAELLPVNKKEGK